MSSTLTLIVTGEQRSLLDAGVSGASHQTAALPSVPSVANCGRSLATVH